MERKWFWQVSIAALLLVGMLVSGARPVQADPQVARYFRETGFSIDNRAIIDYFDHRGGLATFGYPVSRTFWFQGFIVQFFQRQIVQLDQAGHPRLLNTLDPGLLPYRSFNGALFPAVDNGLIASAPNPVDQAATLAYVRAYAPDSYQGVPVGFFQAFINSVPYSVAFPTGAGDAGLLPGFALEMWGIPTSAPSIDPNNHNFIYLRFQRGMMMYDAVHNVTQGVLLADYLKSILVGCTSPADLCGLAQGSPLFGQYSPGAPNWVRNPASLAGTDLTNAFTVGAGVVPPTPPLTGTCSLQSGSPLDQVLRDNSDVAKKLGCATTAGHPSRCPGSPSRAEDCSGVATRRRFLPS